MTLLKALFVGLLLSLVVQPSHAYTPTNALNNTQLQGMSTITYPGGVCRTTFGNGNGAPTLCFQPSGSACSLNSGNGDNGSQVKSADSKCWIAQFPAAGVDPRQWGASVAASDNTVAVNAALAYAAASGSNVGFSAGIFRFTGALSYTFPADGASFSLTGQGGDITTLQFTSAVTTALTITEVGPSDSFHIRDLAVTTGTNKVDTGISVTTTFTSTPVVGVNYPVSDFTNVAFHGSDGYNVTHQWAQAISTLNVGNINFAGVVVLGALPGGGWATSAQGSGVLIAGNSTTVQPVVFNFAGCTFNLVNNGITLGPYVQGVTISSSNFTGDNNGIWVPPGNDGKYSQLFVTASQFNARTGINIQSGYSGLNLSNNFFIVEGTLTSPVGINLNNSQNAYSIISDNIISQGSIGGGIGINVGANASGAVGGQITGNIIVTKVTGISLNAGAKQYTVAHNTLYANTTDIVSDIGANVVDSPLDCTVASFGLYFGGGNTGMVSAARLCTYFQVGKEVTVTAVISLSNKGTSTGNATVSPLPVVSSSSSELGAVTVADYLSWVSAPGLSGYIGSSASNIILTINSAAGSAAATDANVSNSIYLYLKAKYRVP